MVVIDPVTKTLFGKFPREMGVPHKISVYSWRDVERVVEENNGRRDIYISLYDTRSYIIDKMMFDLDILDVELAEKFYTYLIKKEKLPVIPLFTGKKGFHFYVLLRPKYYHDKDVAKALLRKVSFTLVDNAKMYRVVEEGGFEYKVSLLDTSVFGDLRRGARMPNTLRPPENLTYAVYLPPDFYKWSLEEILMWSKEPHYDIEYRFTVNKTLDDLEASDVIYDYLAVPQVTYSQAEVIKGASLNVNGKGDLVRYLSKLIRPCILQNMLKPNPPYLAVLAGVIDLMWAGFTKEDNLRILSKFNWLNYNELIPHYVDIDYIYRKGLLPYKCKKLKEFGLCTLGEDEYCDFWG